MIDHIGLEASDFRKSRAFYLAARAPLGYQAVMELDSSNRATGFRGQAFVLDPDGHNIEAVCHHPAG